MSTRDLLGGGIVAPGGGAPGAALGAAAGGSPSPADGARNVTFDLEAA
ncbi:MAG: hypothetical protein IT375_07465 [Polyangiaceae bacterium]|nr:hypothetical protein [Polyangiaceae bacterium]